MLTLFLTLVLAFLPVRDAPSEVFDCSVSAVRNGVVTFVCNTPNGRETARVPLSKWTKLFPEWDAPVVGMILKGRWDENGRFVAVASCKERTQRAVAEWCAHTAGDCKPPINSLTPDDCFGRR